MLLPTIEWRHIDKVKNEKIKARDMETYDKQFLVRLRTENPKAEELIQAMAQLGELEIREKGSILGPETRSLLLHIAVTLLRTFEVAALEGKQSTNAELLKRKLMGDPDSYRNDAGAEEATRNIIKKLRTQRGPKKDR